VKLETICGIHAVTAIVQRHPAQVESVCFTSARNDQRLQQLQKLVAENAISTTTIDGSEFQEKFSALNHQGVVAMCRPREPLSEPELLKMLSELQEPALVLVLDQITDPHNFGAILRTADAAGVHCVIAPKNASVGMTAVVRKVASGAAETMAYCRVANLARCLAELKSLGIWLYGAAGDKGSQPYGSVDFGGSVAILMGAEGNGLRRLTREACDGLISIPMLGSVESLNVSVATGVCLYEVVRQRSESQSGGVSV
jgi:23S rRNA (guanosine2251-2'-O)-methyltransferase